MGKGRLSNLLLELAGLDIAESLAFVLGEDKLVTLRCAWVDGDEERLAQAQVVRLLVAEERRWTFAEPNLDAQRSYPIKISQKGAMHVVGVRFHTAGLAPFVTPPVHRWNNRVVPVAEVFGKSLLPLEQELRAAGDDLHAQAQLLDAFFLGRLRPTPGQQTLHRLKAKIEAAGGLVRIDELCELGSIAIRQLDRLFRDHLGFSPKTFARIVRFQNALLLLKGHPGCTLADVAARCGYYDQSHFVRDCRTFAGVVPSAQVGYFPAGAPADFSPNLVQFLQDAGAEHGETSLRHRKEQKR